MSSDVRPFVVRRRPQPGPVVVWPLAARAQQPMPVIGYLNFGSPESDAPRLTGLRRGLSETGYVEGRNFVIEYVFFQGGERRAVGSHVAKGREHPGVEVIQQVAMDRPKPGVGG